MTVVYVLLEIDEDIHTPGCTGMQYRAGGELPNPGTCSDATIAARALAKSTTTTSLDHRTIHRPGRLLPVRSSAIDRCRSGRVRKPDSLTGVDALLAGRHPDVVLDTGEVPCPSNVCVRPTIKAGGVSRSMRRLSYMPTSTRSPEGVDSRQGPAVALRSTAHGSRHRGAEVGAAFVTFDIQSTCGSPLGRAVPAAILYDCRAPSGFGVHCAVLSGSCRRSLDDRRSRSARIDAGRPEVGQGITCRRPACSAGDWNLSSCGSPPVRIT